MTHTLKRLEGGNDLSSWIQPTCSCGWEGRIEYAYNDWQMTNVKEQEEEHLLSARAANLLNTCQMKDHEKRELVDALTAIARKFGTTQQLRARIAGLVLPTLAAATQAQIEEEPEQVADEGSYLDTMVAASEAERALREALKEPPA